ncbi:MAG: sensor histidine kinase [Vulcanimicrobiaceae bacterium]
MALPPHRRALIRRVLPITASIMLASLVAFALIAVFYVDRTTRTALDDRLHLIAQAAASVLDVHHGQLALEAADRAEFLAALGAHIDGMVVDARQRIRVSSRTPVPSALAIRIVRFPAKLSFGDVGHGDDRLRYVSLPILRGGIAYGFVVVWNGDDWIDELDRNALIAFGLVSFFVVGLSTYLVYRAGSSALDDAYSRQRRFTADASHELRAPLAVLRAEAELALRRDRDPAAYRAALGSIIIEADRIEDLIADLLALARAEERRRIPGDIAPELRRLPERFGALASVNSVHIETAIDDGVMMISDSESVSRAVSAIMHNALKYAPEGSVVHCTAHTETSAAKLLVIAISDSGVGFSAEALKHGTERFWRDSPSQSGAGLGLAIARELLGSISGTLTLANAETTGNAHITGNANTSGATVRITVPLTTP